jgi:hypothetical protein
MSDDMWWPWPPTEYFIQKEEFERDLSDQMRRMIADLDRIFQANSVMVNVPPGHPHLLHERYKKALTVT